MNRDTGERREKIESKGAYSYDVHKAIRDVQDAFKKSDLRKIGLCLNVLRDICPPEIRKAVKSKWSIIDKKYHEELEVIQNTNYKVRTTGLSDYEVRTTKWSKRGIPWEVNDDGSKTYHIILNGSHLTQHDENRIARRTRESFSRGIWDKIYHERFRACIDCLDRHGELRKCRPAEETRAWTRSGSATRRG